MAKIELNALIGQCLNRRLDDIEVIRIASLAWQQFRKEFRNNKGVKENCQFTTENGRAKLTRFYPRLDD